jgi:hypothetical protein
VEALEAARDGNALGPRCAASKAIKVRVHAHRDARVRAV